MKKDYDLSACVLLWAAVMLNQPRARIIAKQMLSAALLYRRCQQEIN